MRFPSQLQPEILMTTAEHKLWKLSNPRWSEESKSIKSRRRFQASLHYTLMEVSLSILCLRQDFPYWESSWTTSMAVWSPDNDTLEPIPSSSSHYFHYQLSYHYYITFKVQIYLSEQHLQHSSKSPWIQYTTSSEWEQKYGWRRDNK